MQSIVSYPDRGVGGDKKYRGNCSPRLVEDLIDHFQPFQISDYMAGSGSTFYAAQKKGIIAKCYDLRLGYDLTRMDTPERPEFIFFHPPYFDMVNYSGEQYDAQAVINQFGYDPRQSDLSQIHDWDMFIKMLDYCTIKQFTALEKGGRMAVLVGDIKRNRKSLSMILAMAKPGTIENVVIKAQHNCWSDNRTYSGSYIKIVHEYCLILRKDNGLVFDILMGQSKRVDLRQMKNATWRDIIATIMEEIGRPATLGEIYAAVRETPRADGYPTVEEKVRQTLQININQFRRIDRGVWALCKQRDAQPVAA